MSCVYCGAEGHKTPQCTFAERGQDRSERNDMSTRQMTNDEKAATDKFFMSKFSNPSELSHVESEMLPTATITGDCINCATLLARAEQAEESYRLLTTAFERVSLRADTAEAEVKRLREALNRIEQHHNETEEWRDIARAALKGQL